MRYLVSLFVLLSAAALVMVFAGPKRDKLNAPIPAVAVAPPPQYKLEDPMPTGPALPPEEDHIPRAPLDTPIGTTYVVGTTWYDMQHNGTAGKMIGVDNDGYVHLVWMKGLNSSNNPRHVYYNVWDPTTQAMMLAGGVQINNSTRAGYICQAVTPGGFAFPAFHEMIGTQTIAHSSAGIDFLPRAGAFTSFQPAYLYEAGSPLQLIWPKIALGRDSVLHAVSMEQVSISGDPQRIYYSRGNPIWDQDGFGQSIDWQTVGPSDAEFLLMDTAYTVSPDIARSRISDRVAIAYAHRRPGGYANYRNNDLYVRLSEDGGINWGPPLNLTQFTAADDQRAYADVSLLFDELDVLHIAFTTCYFTESVSYSNYKARIWHWDEASQAFSLMASDWTEGTHAPGGWSLNIQRPSLSLDPVTDYLYSSYQKFDQAWWSSAGFPNADAWVTVSTDGGLNWSVGRNVTDTHPTTNPAPAGQSQSERDITLADHVTYSGGDGYLHLEWELDLDAGSQASSEGTVTNNTVYYQRINVNDIPLSPLVPGVPFHVTVGRCCYEDYDYQQACMMTSHSTCDDYAGSWDSTLTCDTPCPQPPQGRCCYGNIFQPTCAMSNQTYCASLGGSWDSLLTCATPCEPFQCTCQSQPYTHCNLVGGPIPDVQTVNYVIAVPIEYHITDVNVCLDLTHTWDADLILSLISPLGTTVSLSYRRGADGDNYTCTTFDDEATLWIYQGAPPFTGSFRPEAPLSAFDGQNAVGNWILRITDAEAQDVGHLNWVCVTFNYDEILPVELTAFSASAQVNGIEVAFRTASETNNDHFEILRGESEQGGFARIALLPSQGNSSSGYAYSYLDESVTSGETYWYYLVDVDLSGTRTEHRDMMSSATMLDAPIPLEYSLSAYPNPFNPTTTIRFSLKEAGDVTLAVYNVSGQWMQSLVHRHYDAGNYAVTFDAKELPSGIYFAKITAGSFVKTEKLVLMK